MAPNRDIVRAFDAATDYERHASIQRRVADSLARRVALLDLPARPRILEIGCGTGFLARALRDRMAGARWLLTDIAPAMLERCASAIGPAADVDYAVLDGEAPDLPANSLDLIVSSFTFQWFTDLEASLARLAALLRPGGQLAFATMAAGSFAEWREAHTIATGVEPAMSDYPTVAALCAMAPPGTTIAVEKETMVETHADARAFLRALRAIGAHRPLHPRPPISPAALKKAMAAFDASGARISYQVAHVFLRRGEAG